MVNINPTQARSTIIKYLLFLNLIYLGELLLFKLRGGVPFQSINLSIAMVNIFGLFLYKILQKYEPLLEPLIVANKFANKVNNFAGKING